MGKPTFFFNSFIVPGDVSVLSVAERVNCRLFDSAHEFVILSVFAAHLTNDLNPGSPSCLLGKSKQDQQ